MKRNILTVTLVCLLICSFLAIACSTSSTSSKTTTSTAASVTTSAATTAAPVTTSSKTAANWWAAEFGEPQYGGEMVLAQNSVGNVTYDALIQMGSGFSPIYETLWLNDFTLDKDTWDYLPMYASFIPAEYMAGLIAKSWEWTDPVTLTVKLREGVHWQDKAPLNGRELTAEDVEYTYDRMLGTGNGFTAVSPWYAQKMDNVARVIATDKYTVQFKFKKESAMSLSQIMGQFQAAIISPEWVEKGDLRNWQNAVGTSPWIVESFTTGTSLIYTRNTNYWGYDSRFPENRLPYLDKVTTLEIVDKATQIAAMRTGKIDFLDRLDLIDKGKLAETNPEIKWAGSASPAPTLELRCDTRPFDDIKVRTALQMAVNLPEIAKSLYGGEVSGLPCGPISPGFKGWAFVYDDWPQSLKDEYAYNPEGAKKLLAEAGYPNGFSTHIVASPMSSSELLQVVKAYFSNINVEMEIQMMEIGVFESFTRAKKADQMIASQWAGGLSSPINSYTSRVSTGTQNYIANNDAYFDDLNAQLVAAKTTEEAKAICTAMDKYALEKHWCVCIFQGISYAAWQPRLLGCTGSAGGTHGGNSVYWARMWVD